MRRRPRLPQFPRSNVERDFRGAKAEASPYPPPTGVRGSAPSPIPLTGKPFLGLSWLSFSRSALRRKPGPCHRPGRTCHHARTPHAGMRCAAPFEDMNPACSYELWTSPRRGIFTHFDHHRPGPPVEDQACPGRPLPEAQNPWDRISGLLSTGRRGLLRKASLERGGHLSMHHALRVAIAIAGKAIPCPVGGRVYG